MMTKLYSFLLFWLVFFFSSFFLLAFPTHDTSGLPRGPRSMAQIVRGKAESVPRMGVCVTYRKTLMDVSTRRSYSI